MEKNSTFNSGSFREEITKAEKALKSGGDMFELITELSPAGIFYTDSEGKCQYINKRLAGWTGLTVGEAKNNGWQKAIHKDDKDRVINVWKSLIKDRGQWDLEYRLVDKKGLWNSF